MNRSSMLSGSFGARLRLLPCDRQAGRHDHTSDKEPERVQPPRQLRLSVDAGQYLRNCGLCWPSDSPCAAGAAVPQEPGGSGNASVLAKPDPAEARVWEAQVDFDTSPWRQP